MRPPECEADSRTIDVLVTMCDDLLKLVKALESRLAALEGRGLSLDQVHALNMMTPIGGKR